MKLWCDVGFRSCSTQPTNWYDEECVSAAERSYRFFDWFLAKQSDRHIHRKIAKYLATFKYNSRLFNLG